MMKGVRTKPYWMSCSTWKRKRKKDRKDYVNSDSGRSSLLESIRIRSGVNSNSEYLLFKNPIN